MDDILVPDRVLNMKSYSVTSETQNRTSRERCHIWVHLQTLKVVSPCKDGEVLHHTGATQHPENTSLKNSKIIITEIKVWDGVTEISHWLLEHIQMAFFIYFYSALPSVRSWAWRRDLQWVQAGQVLESWRAHKRQRVVIKMSGRAEGGEFKAKVIHYARMAPSSGHSSFWSLKLVYGVFTKLSYECAMSVYKWVSASQRGELDLTWLLAGDCCGRPPRVWKQYHCYETL